jgi:hypothetical protein
MNFELIGIVSNCGVFQVGCSRSIYVFSRFAQKKTDFMLELAGIKWSKWTLDGQYLYENKNYFLKRAFMDFSRQYLNTIYPKEVQKEFSDNYNISFDSKIFQKEIDHTRVRFDIEVDDSYHFNRDAVIKTNYALLRALKVKVIIVDNFNLVLKDDDSMKDLAKNIKKTKTEDRKNLELDYQKYRAFNYIKDSLLDKNTYDLAVIGSNITYKGVGKDFDYHLLITETDVLLIDPDKSRFIVYQGDIKLENRCDETGQLYLYTANNEKLLKETKKEYRIIKYDEIGQLYDGN